MSYARIRSTNFTKEEELCLVNIINKYKTIVECKSSNLHTPKEKEQAWTNIAEEFNSMNRTRSLQQIKSKFDNLKTATRKYATLQRGSYSQTGGGPCMKIENVVYDKMLTIINKKTVFGLSNVYNDDCVNTETLAITIPEEDYSEVAGSGNDCGTIIITGDPQTSTSEHIILEIDSGSNTFLSPTAEENTQTWTKYTPKILKNKKNTKLDVTNKPTPKVREARTLYNLKASYIEQKLINLQNEDRRKEELHLKQMQLLDMQIAKINASISEK